MMHLLAQQASESVTGILSGLGSGGAVAVVLWRIHEKSEARHAQVEDALREDNTSMRARLFLLADRATGVADAARKVVEQDTAPQDSELQHQLERVAALLEERGHR